MKPSYLRSAALALCLGMLTLSVSCTTEGFEENTLVTDATSRSVHALEDALLDLVNEYRQEKGLTSLSKLDPAYLKASEHTSYMIATGDVSHAFFYEREAYLKSEAQAIVVAENLAVGYATAEGVFNAWLESEGHRKHIEGTYTHIGISAKESEDGVMYYTQLFIQK